MALPVIIIDSATGSDSLASGAGPGDGTTSGSALTGTNASTDGAGTTVTLDGSPDLTSVATDGSHVIYLADSTAGNRNFGKITAKDNSAKTVTVADAFALSASGLSWAIGGKRASLLGTNSSKLIENNSASGDAMPGWIMQMASGHSETRSSTVTFRRAGDSTSGPIIVRGISGAATLPLLTFSNNGNAITGAVLGWQFYDFEMKNSNATKTSSVAFSVASGSDAQSISGIKCSDSTNNFWKFVSIFSNSRFLEIKDCTIANCASVGIDHTGGSVSRLLIENNAILSCGSHGIYIESTGNSSQIIRGNIIAFNAGDGVKRVDASLTTSYGLDICSNVIHGNAGDGIEIAVTAAHFSGLEGTRIDNNELSFNGGYGIDLSGASMGDAVLSVHSVKIRNNAFYSNTSGKYSGMTVASSQNEATTDPSGGSASTTKDYAGATGGSNFMSSVHKALGYPIGGTLAVGKYSGSYNYQDIGLQHQDSGGGSRVRRGGTIMKM